MSHAVSPDRRAASPGRRVSWGMVILLLGYMLTAPVLVLGPLAGLLLLSRPSTVREWWWLAGAAVWSALWLQLPGGLAEQLARAFGVLVTGIFVALMLWRPTPFVQRAVGAIGLAVAATVAWCWWFGVSWDEIIRAKSGQWWDSYRAWAVVVQASAGAGEPEQAARAADLLTQVQSGVETWAPLSPGLLVLGALLGLAVAWSWYHRIAARPIGDPPGRLRDLWFSDQLVWGFVLAVALIVSPLPAVGGALGRNLLLVFGALYAARGLAVALSAAQRVPRAVVVTLGVVTVFLFPFAVAGLTMLGLADTWLDFRRRMAPSPTGGLDR